MARTILAWAPTGIATPTCKLMSRSDPLTLVETITLTEHATIKRAYTGTIATADAGQYRINLLSGASFIGGDTVTIAATDGLTYEADATARLTANGLDDVLTTAPTGVAANFREMVVQTWRRFFKKATKTSTQIKTYADNGTTVVTTQTVSDDSTTETQGVAS